MNIGLFCAAGMSTSILVERMKEAAQEKRERCNNCSLFHQ